VYSKSPMANSIPAAQALDLLGIPYRLF